MVVLFTMAYVLSFIDRQILTLLVAPIQADLKISDTAIGLLIGAAFAICYTTVGLPIGWLADRVSRVRLAAGGVALWSAMTMACGLAGSYPALFAARIGVGVGEAALTPTAYSLFSDSFPPGKLVRAIGVYMSGAIIGIAAAYGVGGMLVAWVGARPHVDLPLVGVVRGWQAPFFILFVPGMILAIAIMLLREPARLGTRGSVSAETEALAEVSIKGADRVLPYLFVAMGAQSAVVYANLTWTPTLLARRFAWHPDWIGWSLGLVVLTFGLFGNAVGAWVAARGFDRGTPAAGLRLCVASAALMTLVGSLGPSGPTPLFVLLLMGLTITMTSIPTAIAPTMVQLMTPANRRGRVSALYLFVTQMLGLLFGPAAVALLTDFVFRDKQAIGAAQSLSVLIGGLLSLGMFVFALRALRRTIDARHDAGISTSPSIGTG